jgi:uncharacterized protein (DUF697 family)
LKTKILVADHQAFSKHPSSVLRVLENLGPGVVLAEFHSGGEKSRQVDILFANRYGLHLLELKNKKGPIRVESYDSWFVGGEPLVNGAESPAKQAEKTADSLQDRLNERFGKSRNSREKLNVFPWVVLVEQHPESSWEGRSLPPVQRLSRSSVVNGVENLSVEVLNKRAKYSQNQTLNDEMLANLERILGGGFTAPAESKLFGQLLDCQTRNGLDRVSVIARRQGGSFESQPVLTNSEGRFEIGALPQGVYDLKFRLPSGYSDPVKIEIHLMPGLKTTMPVLVYREGMTPEERSRLSKVEHNQEVAKQQAERFRAAAAASHKEIEQHSERISTLEGELEAMFELLAELRDQQVNIANNSQATSVEHIEHGIDDRKAELENKRELRLELIEQSSHLELHASSLMAVIEGRVAAIEDRISLVERNQRKLDAEHVKAERDQAQIAKERWVTEQVDAEKLSENQQRFTRAMTVSALVGTVGGILSLQPLPGPDIVILTPLQVGLVMSISRIYGREMTQDMVVKIIAALGAGMVGQHATVLLYKLIPGAWALGAITVPATFVALGWATAKFLERGTMPSSAERKDVMVRIKNALTDPVLLKEAKETASSVVQEFRSQGASSLKPETIRDIFEGVSRDHPELGKRLSDHLNAPKKPKDTD